jgi:HAD superfamily hydrolase (TIGR01450 family)
MLTTPVLIDFDGVIRLGKSPAPDAGEFLSFLSVNKIPSHIISNSTLLIGEGITKYLCENNLPSDIPAMTSADAALHYVKQNYKRVSVYCVESIRKNFYGFIDDENPEAVLIGDNGRQWNFKMMNEIFTKVFNGADLLAMHMNKFWYPDGSELVMDAGGFIKGIEYSSGKNAILIGKPSHIYFQSALSMLGFEKDNDFIMIGDDPETDIIGAQNCGGQGLLIYSGKTKYPLSRTHKIKPDFEAKNLKEVIKIIKKLVDN